MGFWHMFPDSPVGSSDDDPSRQTVSLITEVGATTATPNLTWEQLNDPGQVTLTPFESLGAIELQGLAVDPSEADRYHFGNGSAADIATIQSIVDAGGTLRVAVRSDESVSTNLRVDWGDGPNDGDESHGMSAILLINEAPPGAFSSAGWNTSLIVPSNSSRNACRIRAVPRSDDVCTSCPHACITPGTLDL